jgi:hypothetical protein
MESLALFWDIFLVDILCLCKRGSRKVQGMGAGGENLSANRL